MQLEHIYRANISILKQVNGRKNRCCINLLAVNPILSGMPHTPLSTKVCWHRIGILLQAQLSGVNIYRGDWHEVIRSGGSFMITRGNLHRIFNQALVYISGTIMFQSFLKAYLEAFWQRSRRISTKFYSPQSTGLFSGCIHSVVIITDRKRGIFVPEYIVLWAYCWT